MSLSMSLKLFLSPHSLSQMYRLLEYISTLSLSLSLMYLFVYAFVTMSSM